MATDYYAVPAADVNNLVPVPARCWAEQSAALQRELPTIPARLRAGVQALEPLFVTQQRHNDLPYPGVCLIGINDTGNGGGGCDAGGSVRTARRRSSTAARNRLSHEIGH